MQRVVTARITPFNPGASPPPVSIPTLRTSAIASPPSRGSSEKSSLAKPFSLRFYPLRQRRNQPENDSRPDREKPPAKIESPPDYMGMPCLVECFRGIGRIAWVALGRVLLSPEWAHRTSSLPAHDSV